MKLKKISPYGSRLMPMPLEKDSLDLQLEDKEAMPKFNTYLVVLNKSQN